MQTTLPEQIRVNGRNYRVMAKDEAYAAGYNYSIISPQLIGDARSENMVENTLASLKGCDIVLSVVEMAQGPHVIILRHKREISWEKATSRGDYHK